MLFVSVSENVGGESLVVVESAVKNPEIKKGIRFFNNILYNVGIMHKDIFEPLQEQCFFKSMYASLYKGRFRGRVGPCPPPGKS